MKSIYEKVVGIFPQGENNNLKLNTETHRKHGGLTSEGKCLLIIPYR